MASFTGIFGTALGDILNEAVGMEQTDTEFDERCDAAFEAFDADGSGTLEFGETLEAFRTFPRASLRRGRPRHLRPLRRRR